MATIKNVKLEAKLDSKFKIESTVRGHSMVVDQSVNAGGADAGANPLEYMFISLAGCLGTVARIIANQRRLELRSMSILIEGDLNMDGLFGKPTDDPTGFEKINVTVDIDSDMSKEEKEAFAHEIHERCPVSWNLANCSSIEVLVP